MELIRDDVVATMWWLHYMPASIVYTCTPVILPPHKF